MPWRHINEELKHQKYSKPWRTHYWQFLGGCSIEKTYLSVSSSSLVDKAPNRSTENKYIAVVARVADSVPIGIERCVSFSEADRFEPAIIPVTAGKKRPTKALKNIQKWVGKLQLHRHKEMNNLYARSVNFVFIIDFDSSPAFNITRLDNRSLNSYGSFTYAKSLDLSSLVKWYQNLWVNGRCWGAGKQVDFIVL